MELTINNKQFTIAPEKHSIETILIFGSFIRGDYEEKSDIDFLIIIDDCSLAEKAQLALDICHELQIPLSWLSLFRISEFRNLCTKGCHFVWSLYFEGKIFYSRNNFIENCFNNLPVYLDMKSDIINHIKRLYTLKNDILNSNRDYGKEISLLGYIIRNTLMILTYSYGYICFSKYDVMALCSNIQDLTLPFTSTDYFNLLKLKEAYKYSTDSFIFGRNIDNYIKSWIFKTEKFLKISLVKICKITEHGFISPFLYPALSNKQKNP